MNHAQTAQAKKVANIIEKSVMWKQVSCTEGRDHTYYLYFANDADRGTVATALFKMFDVDPKDKKWQLSNREVNERRYLTLRIPDRVAEALIENYRESDRLVGASPLRGGVRISTTPPGDHAIATLEENLLESMNRSA